MLINIISHDNGVGLSKDFKILKDIFLKEGWQVMFSEWNVVPTDFDSSVDLNIFLELLNPEWFGLAKKNIFIPNPEWFSRKYSNFLGSLDAIFCKTEAAYTIFKKSKVNVYYSKFTSIDRRVKDLQRDRNRWFHLAGKSSQKGTKVIIETWKSNPSYPHLTIVQHPSKKMEVNAPNIEYISEYVTEERLINLMNECMVHVCLSETEGFGHYIMEGMSTGAAILTTQFVPMTEMVNEKRGVLVKPYKFLRQNLARNAYVREREIKAGVLKMLNSDIEAMGRESRAFFEENDMDFKTRLIELVNKVFQAPNIY